LSAIELDVDPAARPRTSAHLLQELLKQFYLACLETLGMKMDHFNRHWLTLARSERCGNDRKP
jgi:hypothetical protein